MPENIRQEALDALAKLAIADPAFVADAFADLEATLARYGFSLNDQEMDVVRDFQRRVRDRDEEIVGLLRNPRVLYADWRHEERLRD